MTPVFSSRSLALALYWVCAVTALWLMGSSIDQHEQQRYPGEPESRSILSGFNEVVSSIEGVPASSLKNFHRGGQVGISQTFALHAPLHESMAKIELSMSTRGWVTVKKATYRDHPSYMKLCKSGLSAAFSADRTYAEKRLDVRVVWAKDPNQSGYCAR